MMAISIHAVPIVFCVGTDMISSGLKKIKIIIYIVVLSLNTPLGILIGILVTLHMEDATGGHILLIGVLQVCKYFFSFRNIFLRHNYFQGLAAGTLLYITFFEVLARDKLTR